MTRERTVYCERCYRRRCACTLRPVTMRGRWRLAWRFAPFEWLLARRDR